MSITKLIIPYFLTFAVFFIIDMAWLGFVAKDFYRKHLSNFLTDNVNWVAAFVFYFLFVIGVFIFAIVPSVEKNSLSSAIMLGALFGFFTYATYDLTNLATLKDWPITIVFIDIIWGTVLTGIVSTAGFYILTYFQGHNW
jgi:uncharacterized membrane protein